jgi:hypothetical protein
MFNIPNMQVLEEDNAGGLPPHLQQVAQALSNPSYMEPLEPALEQVPLIKRKTPSNLKVSDAEQSAIVVACEQFKKYAIDSTRLKREKQARAYGYINNTLCDDDLLPVPKVKGSEHDTKSDRPQVFVPISKQQAISLYSEIKMKIFPNDEDFFRVKSKTAEGYSFEDTLTEGLKFKFKEHKVSEKLGSFLWDLIWAGNASCHPYVKRNTHYKWKFNDITGEWKEVKEDGEGECEIEVFTPLSFFIDPRAKNTEDARWVHCGIKHLHELKDNPLYMNTDNLQDLGGTEHTRKQATEQFQDTVNDLSYGENDGLKKVEYDLYYFPVLETNEKTYRNILVGIAGGSQLVRFQPNTYAEGKNPAVFCNWRPNSGTAEGTGPIEDMLNLQRIINMLMNYVLESLARNGNRWLANESVDLEGFFGTAGGIAVLQNGGRVQDSMVSLSGDFQESQIIMNLIGLLKAEAQIMSGSQNPFQGSSEVDYQKTATELQILDNKSITISNEVIEHIVATGIQPILERLAYLMAETYVEPFSVRLESGEYSEIDLDHLKTGQFVIELVNINPASSKLAQINNLVRLYQMSQSNPELYNAWRNNGYDLLRKIATLQGEKGLETIMHTPEEIRAMEEQLQQMQEMQASQGMPPQQGMVA